MTRLIFTKFYWFKNLLYVTNQIIKILIWLWSGWSMETRIWTFLLFSEIYLNFCIKKTIIKISIVFIFFTGNFFSLVKIPGCAYKIFMDLKMYSSLFYLWITTKSFIKIFKLNKIDIKRFFRPPSPSELTYSKASICVLYLNSIICLR